MDDLQISPAVRAMLAGGTSATAPLVEFVEAYSVDDNLWWKTDCGHHQNLFEEACDRLEVALSKLEAIRRVLDTEPIGWRDLREPIRAVLDGVTA